MEKFRIIGIKEPGRINVKLEGRFRDIELHEASDEILEKLYEDGCPYIQVSPNEFTKRHPGTKEIKAENIDLSKHKTKSRLA